MNAGNYSSYNNRPYVDNFSCYMISYLRVFEKQTTGNHFMTAKVNLKYSPKPLHSLSSVNLFDFE